MDHRDARANRLLRQYKQRQYKQRQREDRMVAILGAVIVLANLALVTLVGIIAYHFLMKWW